MSAPRATGHIRHRSDIARAVERPEADTQRALPCPDRLQRERGTVLPRRQRDPTLGEMRLRS